MVVTTHQFRHNGITDRLAAGFTAAQIAEMTGHHGDAMIFNAYAHLNLMPETIREKQNYVLAERQESDKRYVLFGGRILNMDEPNGTAADEKPQSPSRPWGYMQRYYNLQK